MYKVTVIIPFYNGEKHLRRAFNSVKTQTLGFNNIEVILINDCSKDSSPEIAREYSIKYDNVKFIDTSEFFDKNSGFPGRPRNFGLKECSSEYVIFLDTDDTYRENAFEILYNTIENNDVDLALGNYYINSNGNIIKNILLNYDDDLILNPLKDQETFNKISNMTFISSWGKIFKKDLIEENNLKFIEDGPVEDADFYFKYLVHVDKIAILPNDYVYCYNEYSDSTIHTHNKSLFLSFFKGFKRICNFFEENYSLSYKLFFNEYLSALLLIFVSTEASKEEKIELMQMLYDFENNNPNVEIKRVEVALLNRAIRTNHFESALVLAKAYNLFYNNVTIKKVYRKFNNFRRNRE